MDAGLATEVETSGFDGFVAANRSPRERNDVIMSVSGPDAQAPQSLRVGVDTAGPAVVVSLHGAIDARATAFLRSTLGVLVAAHPRIVVDLGSVSMIDAAGLSVLMRSYRNARQHGGLFCLTAAPRALVHQVLRRMQLDTYFPVFDDRPRALAWLAARRLPSDLVDNRTDDRGQDR